MLPTSEEMASFGEFLFWSHVESNLETRLPYGAQLAIKGGHLTVTLGNGKRVVAGVVDRPTSYWVVAYNGVSHALPLETDRDSIIDFVAAAATAIHEDRPIASPYRWGQLERSPVLDVADLLAARDLEIRSAITTNRMIARDGRPAWVKESEGHFLEVSNWDRSPTGAASAAGCATTANASVLTSPAKPTTAPSAQRTGATPRDRRRPHPPGGAYEHARPQDSPRTVSPF